VGERKREQTIEVFYLKYETRYEGYGAINAMEYSDDGSRYPTSVLRISNWNGALFGNSDNATVHPTEKPVELFEWLIKTYTNEGFVVIDNCVGSGTTIEACRALNRHYICWEKEEEFYNLARGRERMEIVRQQKMFE
jgi:site-specific DNA-methyltransferase (adenine-specific)